MWEFILERYNYWIVITLMMTGLYIVFSRGNLVKTIIGLNVFQTSVFIFYITIGKIAGGTAPILMGGHGGGHDGQGDHTSATHGADAAHDVSVKPTLDDLRAGSDAAEAAGEVEAHSHNDLAAAMKGVEQQPAYETQSLHSLPDMAQAAQGNSILADPGEAAEAVLTPRDQGLHDMPEAGLGADGHETLGHEAVTSVTDAAAHAADIIYTNPLPHVLILTAIVVGVATTAVGLALAVRIQEAYGTIEEDELEAEDYEAEFGERLAGSEAR